jgi:predicted nucleotidyltransferase
LGRRYDRGESSEIKEIRMLELGKVDLGALAEALEDHSDFIRWFIDPVSGEILAWSEDMDEVPDPEESGAVFIEPIPSFEAYSDMRDFVAGVPDRRASDLLGRAIEGRGAFRRFKDTLFEFPQLRETWFEFHDVRMRRRAIEWLVDADLIDESTAESALSDLLEPPLGDGVADPLELARQTAVKMRELFGSRLVDVVVFGSYARGTASDDSDLDLAVVLRDVKSSWADGRLMDDLLWETTLESGICVSALVVDADDWGNAEVPVLKTARESGRSVA